MKKTTVRRHTRKLASNKRVIVKRHKRAINRLNTKKQYKLSEIYDLYEREGYYVPSDLMAGRHGATKQFVKQNADGTQNHARVYDQGKQILVEEHTDLVSPEVDPAGHVAVDVGEVTFRREVLGENPNRTEVKVLRKKRRRRKRK